MFSFSVMPIQVMCSMTVPSPLDRGFVSIVSLLSSSPTDRRVKYRCVPNPDNSVSIQWWPKHEIPTLLTFSGVFFLGGGELFLDTETIFKVDFFVSYQKIVIIYTTCKLSNFWLWKKRGFFVIQPYTCTVKYMQVCILYVDH